MQKALDVTLILGFLQKVLAVTLILGFLAVDFLFFHDFFKPGEVITLPQYLTGLLSIPVLIGSLRALLWT